MTDITTADRAFETPRDLVSKVRMWFDSDHICVLTIGKTASSAIIQSLINAGIPAYQAHTLSRAPQEYLFVSGLPKRPVQNVAFQVKTSAWLWLTHRREKQFITTFRDPFARNMSAFFEQSWKLGISVKDISTEELVAIYERHGPHDATKRWFNENLSSPFGLQIGQVDLVSNPTQELTAGNRKFLLLKYEDQSNWEQALSVFSGKSVILARRNDSARKPYADAMSRLGSVWRPSPAIVSRSLDMELWNAIYSAQEKQEIRHRWKIPVDLAPD